MPAASLDHHIEATPGVCGGRPRIAGRRITVAQVACWHRQMGWPIAKIVSDFGLSDSDVHAAMAYYFDHQHEIDEQSARDAAFVEEHRRQTPSLLQGKLPTLPNISEFEEPSANAST